MARNLLHVLMLLGAMNANANVVGNGHQNFNTIPNGLDFVTVHSSETLKPGIINVGFFLNYAVNTLPYFEGADQKRTHFNDNLLGADINLGVGLTNNIDIGISFPFVVNQRVGSEANFHGEFVSTGNTEVRLLGKIRVYGEDDYGVAFVGSVNVDRTQDNPYMGQNPGLIYNLEIAADKTINRWAIGFNLGHRWVNSGAPIPGARVEPIGNQLIGSVAASYLLDRIDTKLIFEVFGSKPAQQRESNPKRAATSGEFLFGVKHDYNTSLALHGGIGTEIEHGVSSPDWRIYTGVNYAFGPVFKKPSDVVVTDEKIVLRSVLFEFDSDNMISESDPILGEVIATLRKRPFKKIVITGHTDSVGPREYNLRLSERRAAAIRNYLIEKGQFKPAEVESIGKGDSEPVADNGNFQGRQANRRVEFTIIRD